MSLRRLCLAAVLGLLSSSAIGGVCGDDKGTPGVAGHFVVLMARPKAPFFYYRLGDYVFLAEPSALLGQLDSWSAGQPKAPVLAASALRSRILSALPLRANTDLYGYSIEDPDLWTITRSLVIELIEAEKAAVIDDGGYALQRLYVEHDRRARSVRTDIRLGKPATAFRLIERVDCIAD
jgi:hypothetical protein